MNLRVYVPLTWTPAGSWLLYLPFPPRWNPVFTGWGYSFFGAILPGRGEPNGVHFPLRLTFFVHCFRPETPKNRSHLLGGGCFGFRLAGSSGISCQKSAGIDRLWVEKPGWNGILAVPGINPGPDGHQVAANGGRGFTSGKGGMDTGSFTLPVLLS